MSTTVSDLLIDRLHRWGVDRVYGRPTAGIEALKRAASERADMRFVAARSGGLAALMASAHARVTGEPGVCFTASGAETARLMEGLEDARLDHQPIVVIVGQRRRPWPALRRGRRSHARPPRPLRALPGSCVTSILAGDDVAQAVDRAMDAARAERRVACVVVPTDVQAREMPAAAPDPAAVGLTPPCGSQNGSGGAAGAGAPEELSGLLPLIAGLLERAPEHALVTCGSRAAADWLACRTDAPAGRVLCHAKEPAQLCRGVPAPIATKFAYPDRPVVSLVGEDDEATEILGNDGLVAVARHWRQWSDPRLIVLVLNGGGLRSPRRLSRFSYAAYADLLGLCGLRIGGAEGVPLAWDQALAAQRPVVMDVAMNAGEASVRAAAQGADEQHEHREENIRLRKLASAELLIPVGA